MQRGGGGGGGGGTAECRGVKCRSIHAEHMERKNIHLHFSATCT